MIVDKDAIEKVETKVYKGFSVGVQPLVVRGNDVEKLDWFENSLVDRPADPDAIFSVARADGVTDPDAGADATLLEEGEELPTETNERGVFADKMAQRENPMKRGLAFEVLYGSIDRIMRDASITDPEAAVREAIGEFADYVAPLVATRQIPDELCYGAGLSEDLVTRFADVSREAVSLSTERTTALTRAERAEADLVIVRGKLTTAEEQITTLKRTADPSQKRPVRIPGALERNAVTGTADQSDASQQAETLQTELTRLYSETSSEPDFAKRQANVVRMQQLKMQIADLPAAETV